MVMVKGEVGRGELLSMFGLGFGCECGLRVRKCGRVRVDQVENPSLKKKKIPIVVEKGKGVNDKHGPSVMLGWVSKLSRYSTVSVSATTTTATDRPQ